MWISRDNFRWHVTSFSLKTVTLDITSKNHFNFNPYYIMNIGLYADQTLGADEAELAAAVEAHHHILVVDDEESMRAFAEEALHSAGYRTHTAESGTSAMDAIRAEHYDLILTDFNMPNGSGADLIIKMHSEGFTIPVIMMTGSALTKELLTHTSMLHVRKILQKPFGMDVLLAAVQKNLQPAEPASHHEVINGTDPENSQDLRKRRF
jgi:DNA-binding NtrC family response regulator